MAVGVTFAESIIGNTGIKIADAMALAIGVAIGFIIMMIVLILIKSVKYAKPFMQIDKPLIIYEENGDYTDEVIKIYGGIVK